MDRVYKTGKKDYLDDIKLDFSAHEYIENDYGGYENNMRGLDLIFYDTFRGDNTNYTLRHEMISLHSDDESLYIHGDNYTVVLQYLDLRSCHGFITIENARRLWKELIDMGFHECKD